MTWETILKRQMVDFDVTDGICCSRAKTDIIRYWEQKMKNVPGIDNHEKIIQFVKTTECKDVKIWAQKMIDNPNSEPEWKTFWTELVNNWKRCEGGAF